MLLRRAKFAVRDNFLLEVSSLGWKKKVENDCSGFYLIILFNGIERQLVPLEQKGKITKPLDLSCGTERERRKGKGGESIFKNSM